MHTAPQRLEIHLQHCYNINESAIHCVFVNNIKTLIPISKRFGKFCYQARHKKKMYLKTYYVIFYLPGNIFVHKNHSNFAIN